MNADDDVTTMTDCGGCVSVFGMRDGKSVSRRVLVGAVGS